MASQTKPKFCPACGSPRVATVLYGKRDWTEELREVFRTGQAVDGGCILRFGKSPRWACTNCKHYWEPIQQPELSAEWYINPNSIPDR
jgi:hypothetical protein